MRYIHPNKAPQTPMYYWIARTYEKHRIELENMLELSAIHWYELYKEREKYFQATPIKLFWESIKEQFPEAYIDTGLLPKTMVEVEENNKQLKAENERLRAENERLKEALQSMFDACMKADEQGELSELISGELLDSVGKLLGYTPENEKKKNRELIEAIAEALNEVTK